ncbi:MHYT domain-containing protein [Microvirga massiliensis]|uniref:MHYT domain-containing protein n=1 Tax=Microvirga massiliensis TaxID=1033741 RepID=UPI00062BC076|nr:MHYT domain-containing protein [Microvirga massiliensis]
MTISGTHDFTLVALSILIATAASYTALDLAGRIQAATGWASHAWLVTAAVAMGGGIWSMHFVAMLAFHMPGMAVNYDLGLTLLSLALPILVTGSGFFVVNRTQTGSAVLALSGLFMGLGIVAMHYTGMVAMRMAADLRHNHLWVAISVLIAIGAATVALWLAFRKTGLVQKLVAALAMGLAISGMHFAAMQGAVFTAHSSVDHAHGQASLNQTTLALAVAATTFLILFLALIAAMFDRRLALLAEREAAALRDSEERFRRLYKKTPLPLHAVNEAGQIEHVSDAWLALLGYRRDEVVGRPLTDFMTEDSIQHRNEVVWPALREKGELRDAEYRLINKSGDVLDVLISGRVERDAEGRFSHIVGGIVDVTARKKAEEALRQAQKIEAVGHLTGGVAHDFNNLLAVVLGNLELLRKRLPDDPKLTRLVDSAIQGAQRGAALTQRMLAFARRQDLKPEPVDVPDLVKGMTDLLQRSIGPMVQIETRFPLALPCARVDANQLELALLNLVVNARDAMPAGGIIAIAAHQRSISPAHPSGLAPGGYLCLSVTDTGQGMDEATLARALEPFFTTKGVGRGTGLGLSMVHGLAAQSGGRLVLKSREGAGTTAEIWLPVAEAQPPQAARSREPATNSTGSGTRPLAVLVVDDDALVLQNTAAMLEDLGHHVVEAGSGQEALDHLDTGMSVDVVITDQVMPGLTGLQLTEAIRRRWPHLPVIVATGYAELSSDLAPDLVRITKPYTQDTLARAVAEGVRRATAGNVVPFRLISGAEKT